MIICAVLLILSCSVSKIAVEGADYVSCKKVTLAEGESVYITHPGHPRKSPKRVWCSSHVTTSSDCNWLSIEIQKIQINNRYPYCTKEYVQIDGYAPGYTTKRIGIARGCHFILKKKITLPVKFPAARIVYHVRGLGKKTWGFRFKITAERSMCCATAKLIDVGDQLVMKTPGNSPNYANKFFCLWKTNATTLKRYVDVSCNSFASISNDDVFKFTYKNGSDYTWDVKTYTDLHGFYIDPEENYDTEAYFISNHENSGSDVSCTITLMTTYKIFDSVKGGSLWYGTSKILPGWGTGNYTGTLRYRNLYTIFKDHSSVCYFKLIFDYMHIGDGLGNSGDCQIDMVKQTDCAMPTVCGITTDGSFHFFLNVTDPAIDKCKFEAQVNRKNARVYERSYEFTFENIDCDSDDAPPSGSGCQQYYTAESGTVKSPMFQDSGHTVINAKLDYKICIKSDGYCRVKWEVTPGVTEPFKIGSNGFTTALVGDTSCATDYVEINGLKHCGGYLNPTEGEATNTAIYDTTFEIRVVTDATDTYSYSDDSTHPSGFSLDYTLETSC